MFCFCSVMYAINPTVQLLILRCVRYDVGVFDQYFKRTALEKHRLAGASVFPYLFNGIQIMHWSPLL